MTILFCLFIFQVSVMVLTPDSSRTFLLSCPPEWAFVPALLLSLITLGWRFPVIQIVRPIPCRSCRRNWARSSMIEMYPQRQDLPGVPRPLLGLLVPVIQPPPTYLAHERLGAAFTSPTRRALLTPSPRLSPVITSPRPWWSSSHPRECLLGSYEAFAPVALKTVPGPARI